MRRHGEDPEKAVSHFEQLHFNKRCPAEKSRIAKISIVIRRFFAYIEGSSAGSGAGGTLPNWQSGFTRKGLHLCSLWAFVSLPVYCGPEGIQNAKP